MKRNNWIRLRVSDDEKKLIETKAKENKLGVSDYIRNVAMGTREVIIEVKIK